MHKGIHELERRAAQLRSCYHIPASEIEKANAMLDGLTEVIGPLKEGRDSHGERRQ